MAADAPTGKSPVLEAQISSHNSSKAEPEYAKRLAGETNRQKSAFYNDDISPKLTVKTRQLLEEYSGIPAIEVIPHIHAIRDKAWDLRAYPCIGSGIYLDPVIPKHPVYADVLSRLKDDPAARLLEIGSFMGGDLRTLVADGASSQSLIATDVVNFWDLGYELFRDKDKFQCQYVEADMMDAEGALKQFRGSIDAIHISKVMHQWNFERQVEGCIRLVELGRRGCIIFGDQMGGKTGHELKPYPDLPGLWMHDPDSWSDLWNIVQEKTGTKWNVHTTVKTIEEMKWDREDYQYLREDANILFFHMERTE